MARPKTTTEAWLLSSSNNWCWELGPWGTGPASLDENHGSVTAVEGRRGIIRWTEVENETGLYGHPGIQVMFPPDGWHHQCCVASSGIA
jgi:hypothetical protein